MKVEWVRPRVINQSPPSYQALRGDFECHELTDDTPAQLVRRVDVDVKTHPSPEIVVTAFVRPDVAEVGNERYWTVSWSNARREMGEKIIEPGEIFVWTTVNTTEAGFFDKYSSLPDVHDMPVGLDVNRYKMAYFDALRRYREGDAVASAPNLSDFPLPPVGVTPSSVGQGPVVL